MLQSAISSATQQSHQQRGETDMSTCDIAEAREAFAQRDRLQAELDAVNARLIESKARYMERTRIWGIRDERFRQEINA
jgi:hypothetical protein